MRVSATFENLEQAVLAHKAILADGQVDPEDIEVRSPYPLFEEPLPPHRHRPMRIRNWVRFLWVCGAVGGFSLAAFCQLDYPIRTSGHPMVPIPIDAIITYECAQITALIMTATFFFIETREFRMRPIPQAEDLDVASGSIAIVVDGPRAEATQDIFKKNGANVVRTFPSIVMLLATALMLMGSLTGCSNPWRSQKKEFPLNFQVRMRAQPALRDSETVHAPYASGVYSMPWSKDPDITRDARNQAIEEPYGRLLTPEVLEGYKKMGAYPKQFTPASLKNVANPIAPTADNLKRAETLYAQNCQMCHGQSGKGDGAVGPLFAPPPADLHRKDLVAATDGDLYWTITVGPSTMPAFGTKMSPEDRFAIVQHVRVLQGKITAPAPDAAKK